MHRTFAPMLTVNTGFYFTNMLSIAWCRSPRRDTSSSVRIYVSWSESSISPAAQPRQRRHRNVALIDVCFSLADVNRTNLAHHQQRINKPSSPTKLIQTKLNGTKCCVQISVKVRDECKCSALLSVSVASSQMKSLAVDGKCFSASASENRWL